MSPRPGRGGYQSLWLCPPSWHYARAISYPHYTLFHQPHLIPLISVASAMGVLWAKAHCLSGRGGHPPLVPMQQAWLLPLRATTGCRALPAVEKGMTETEETQTHPSSIFPPADSQGQQNPDGASPPQPHPTRTHTHTLSLPPLFAFLCVKWVDCWFCACPSPISISRPFPSFPALAWRVRDQDPRRPKGHSHPLYPSTAVPTVSMVASVAKTGPGPLQLS